MTLTEYSVLARKVLPLGIIGILGALIAFFSVQIILTQPAPTEVPVNPYDLVYGKISPIGSKDATSSAGFNFTFDTIEGIPVSPAEHAQVYFIPENNRQIGFSLKTDAMAETLGFDIATSPGKVNFPIINYEDDKQKLEVDITRYNYDYQYVLGEDDEFLQKLVSVPEPSVITREATEFLQSVGRYPDELAQGKPNIVYLTFDPVEKKINISDNPQEANMVEVDFYRGDVEEYPSVTSSYFNSQNYVLMLYHSKGMKVVRSQVNFYETAPDQVGIYPLKSGDAAWQQVVEGKGVVAYSEPGVKDVTIKEMFLAYYDPSEYTEYFQPVYVFLGGRESNFAIYVSAVDDSQLLTEDGEDPMEPLEGVE